MVFSYFISVPKCPKGKRAKCFTVKFCYRKLRICGCFSTKKYGDETEFDTQVNDEMQIATQDDEEEQFDENGKLLFINIYIMANISPFLRFHTRIFLHFYFTKVSS